MLSLGNFMGDFVKGNDFENYNEDMRKGILMHRAIDDFTDNNATTKRMREMLAVHFGKFTGIIIDMYYDYFLAANWKRFSKTPLLIFSLRFYALLIRHKKKLPPTLQRVIFNIIATNRLYSYRTKKGLKNALNLMGRVHAVIPENIGTQAVQVLNENYDELQAMFFVFFEAAIEKFLNVEEII